MANCTTPTRPRDTSLTNVLRRHVMMHFMTMRRYTGACTCTSSMLPRTCRARHECTCGSAVPASWCHGGDCQASVLTTPHSGPGLQEKQYHIGTVSEIIPSNGVETRWLATSRPTGHSHVDKAACAHFRPRARCLLPRARAMAHSIPLPATAPHQALRTAQASITSRPRQSQRARQSSGIRIFESTSPHR